MCIKDEKRGGERERDIKNNLCIQFFEGHYRIS